jgi:hypothetical protein
MSHAEGHVVLSWVLALAFTLYLVLLPFITHLPCLTVAIKSEVRIGRS